VFASALDFHGWCRSAKDEDAALQALLEYRGRYADALGRGGATAPPGRVELRVVERLTGSATTDFGAPGATASIEREPMSPNRARTLLTQLRACWAWLDDVVARSPAELHKGRRGGGRDRNEMVDHVLGAECVYARKLGARHRQPAIDDRSAIDALRHDLGVVIGLPANRLAVERGWYPRYAARRTAWHALDHAWEMEDRS